MEEYNDIINLPHHVSKNHPPMPMMNRAAQFAPFAALTGYDAVIQETGRLTDGFIELDDSKKEQLNRKIAELMEQIDERPMVTIIFFKPDERKAGGTYSTVSGKLKKVDEFRQLLVLEDETPIPFNCVFDIR
ncbi:MAG: hypothetical protein J5637_02500 [Prevotella sp.]|nr:hypothetical protein [Prevotella sp.]